MKAFELEDYPAIIHCHSTYSDGARPIPEIAKIASEVGIRFLLMTDHNHLKPLEDGHNRWYDDVLVDIGYEINDANDQNHFLAFGLKNEVNRSQRARDYVREVIDNGGFGFLAHPHEERTDLPDWGIYPWTDWETEQFTGIEIWNHMSSWMEGLSSSNRLIRFIHPRQSVWAPSQKTLDFWDKIATTRRVTGIGGVDAHGYRHNIVGNLSVAIFRYKVLFKCLRTYVLLEEKDVTRLPFIEAQYLLHEALKKGTLYFAQYYLGDPSGFRFWAQIKDRVFQMGDEFTYEMNTKIKAFIPQKNNHWRLHRDGKVILNGKSQQIEFTVTTPGVYRLSVYRKKRPWLYSNHLYIRADTR